MTAPDQRNRVPDVLTFGEAMMLFTGSHSRPLHYGSTAETAIAGAEFNLAVNLSRLGHQVRWVSAVGQDLFGREIIKTARGENIDVSQVLTDDGAPTGVIFKSPRGWAEPEVMYYRSGSACSHLTTKSFTELDWGAAKHLFVTGITPALSSSCRELTLHAVQQARKSGTTIWLDPNFRRKLWSLDEFCSTMRALLPLADFFLPGRSEAECLTGENDLPAMAQSLLDYGAGAVIIKDGLSGAHWFTPDGTVFEPPVSVPKVINPIGAGDAFAAGLISGTLDNLSPSQTLQRAHALGALACSCDGDWEGAPTRDELSLFLGNQLEAAR